MNKVTVTSSIFQPEMNDHESGYPKFLCNTQKKQYLFELITMPENISNALVLAQETGSSPVVVFESRISHAITSNAIEPIRFT